ncbi:hypothetical protein [Pukyongiella litopenaei]|uniref:Uncharacterized protein n=1 Tax=Pukyongiella litopenaei TaxID=2605946 RepID=A0A2S0MKK3_9RHOB|nr:hypothetical protein [Pukyongiella litopenaei]AVO36357.1 hypothetical protein C6Y53_00610 [Pukyongiella litopenaei]
MQAGILHPADIGPTDADRILRFLNGAADANALAETVGFSDGLGASRRVAAELIAARPFRNLDQVLAVTGMGVLRFTELAVALSGARPPLAPDRLQFLPVEPVLWLGQSINIAAQLTNPDGIGIVTRHVTCIASDGILSARSGLRIQAGTAIRIAPEPGGLVRFSFGPDLSPPLDDSARAALAAELSQLDRTAETPGEADKGIAALAARYRGQCAGALQTAIDRLFETHDIPVISRLAPWPLQPVTLLALTHDDAGQVLQAASLTLELRNWLGAFHIALAEQINNDRLLPDALKHLAADAEAGRDLSRQIIQATQGYAALERGAVGRRLRDASTGGIVNAFLDASASTLKGDAIVNTVRAAGASEAAIAAGGFAVFEAIRSVQEVGDTIKPPPRFDGLTRDDLHAFDTRLATLEGSSVTKTELSRFERNLTADMTSRVAEIERDAVSQGDLDQLRQTITAEIDTRIARLDPGREINDRLAGIDGRLEDLEGRAVTQRDLDALHTSLTRDLDARIAQVDDGGANARQIAEMEERLKAVESGAVSKRDLDRFHGTITEEFDAKLKLATQRSISETRLETFRAEVDRDIDARMETMVPRAEMDERIAAVETDMANQLRTKANARSLSSLRASLDQMNQDQNKLRTDLTTLERKTVTIRRDGRS